MPRARKYPVELLERGARLVFESDRPITHIAAELGVPSETLKLRKENAELRRANEILRAASLFFAGELDPNRPK